MLMVAALEVAAAPLAVVVAIFMAIVDVPISILANDDLR
jgi:hypothetical protein